MSTNLLLRGLARLGLALLITVALALPKHGFVHNWGTLSNDWTTEPFGWPFEIWSRTIHTYSGQADRPFMEKDRYYSIHWGRASGLYVAAVAFVAGAAAALGRVRTERGQP
jgi:hypothetical protein